MKNYDELINEAPVVLVEFFASWCPHCQKMMPVVGDMREKYKGRMPVYQLDIDNNEEASTAAEVDVIPTFILYKDGKPAWRYSGEIAADVLEAEIQKVLKAE